MMARLLRLLGIRRRRSTKFTAAYSNREANRLHALNERSKHIRGQA